jgi:putative hemolysin
MTPRREVDMIDLTADPEDIRRTIVESVHSRLPAHAGTPEEMLGVVQAKDLLDAYLRGERPDIRAQVRPAPNVPDTSEMQALVLRIRQFGVDGWQRRGQVFFLRAFGVDARR